jgi:hypothetical protein
VKFVGFVEDWSSGGLEDFGLVCTMMFGLSTQTFVKKPMKQEAQTGILVK